jgi:hypothetical protein
MNMTKMTEIKPAIARSISHNEIVLLVVDDPKAALESIDNDESVADLDWSTENNGDLDVWGTRLGDDFRLRLRADK